MGYRIYNNITQQYEGADADQIPELLSTGNFKLANDEKIRVQSPDGETFEAGPESDFAAMARDGFVFEKFEAKKQREAVKAAEEQPGLALATGALRGATFGLSDVAFAGIDQAVPGVKEKVSALKEANPLASGIGEAAGAIGSAVLAPGGGLVGRAGALGTKGSMELGKVLGVDLGEKLVIDGVTNTTKQLIKRGIARGAGSAIEGALYGGAQTISEAALGNPKEAAENLVSNVGFGALFGGAFGAAGGGFLDLARGKIGGVASKKVSDAIESAASANAAIRGIDDEKIGKLFSQWGDKETNEFRQQVTKYMANPDEAKTTFVNGMQKLFDASNEISYGLTGATNDKLITTLGQAKGKEARKAVFDAIDLMRANRSKIRSILADEVEGELHNKGFMKKMDALTTKYRNELADVFNDKERSVSDAFKVMFKYRKEVDNVGKKFFGKNTSMLSGVERTTKEWFDEFRGGISQKLQDFDSFGPLASENKEINQAVSKYLRAQEFFTKKFGTKSINEAGKEIYVIDPTKMGNFLNDQSATRNALKKQIFDKYISSMDNLVNFAQSKNYLQGLPAETLDLIKNIQAQQTMLGEIRGSLKAINMIQSYTGKSLGGMLMGGMFGSTVFGPAAGAIGAAAGWAMNNPVTVLRVLTKAESAILQNKNRMAEAANSFFSGKPIRPRMEASATRAGGLNVLAQIINAVSSDDENKNDYVPVKGGRSDVPEMMTRLYELDPMRINDVTQKNLRVMYEAAPLVAGQVATVANTAVQFLQTKLPPQPQLAGPFSKKTQIKPSPAQAAKFERYAQAVFNPTGTLDLLNKGSLTSEHVEAIKAVYPMLYAQAQQAAMMASQFSDKEVSYRKKLMLANLFSIPTVPGLQPQNFQATQAMYASQNEPQGGSMKPMKLASNFNTSTQQVMTQ